MTLETRYCRPLAAVALFEVAETVGGPAQNGVPDPITQPVFLVDPMDKDPIRASIRSSLCTEHPTTSNMRRGTLTTKSNRFVICDILRCADLGAALGARLILEPNTTLNHTPPSSCEDQTRLNTRLSKAYSSLVLGAGRMGGSNIGLYDARARLQPTYHGKGTLHACLAVHGLISMYMYVCVCVCVCVSICISSE